MDTKDWDMDPHSCSAGIFSDLAIFQPLILLLFYLPVLLSDTREVHVFLLFTI